jgi:hypothetical protein
LAYNPHKEEELTEIMRYVLQEIITHAVISNFKTIKSKVCNNSFTWCQPCLTVEEY